MVATPFDYAAFAFNGLRANGPSAIGTSGQPLRSNGTTGFEPGDIDLANDVTGLLAWANMAGVTVSEVLAHTGNGQGSTNTKIRRYTSNSVSGSGLTYADSSTLGGTITTAASGLLLVIRADERLASACTFGMSLDSNQLTTQVENITAAHILGYDSKATAFKGCVTAAKYVSSGQVLRGHDGFTVPTNSDAGVAFLRALLLHI